MSPEGRILNQNINIKCSDLTIHQKTQSMSCMIYMVYLKTNWNRLLSLSKRQLLVIKSSNKIFYMSIVIRMCIQLIQSNKWSKEISVNQLQLNQSKPYYHCNIAYQSCLITKNINENIHRAFEGFKNQKEDMSIIRNIMINHHPK